MFDRLLLTTLAIGSGIGCFLAGSQLQIALESAHLQRGFHALQVSARDRRANNSDLAKDWTPQAQALLDSSVEAEKRGALTLDGMQISSQLLRERAFAEPEMQKRIGYLCESLAQLQKIVAQNPASAGALMSWASTRQLLGAAQCPESKLNSDFKPVVEKAIELAPNNPAVQFSGGLLLFWSGDRAEASRRFNRAIAVSTALTAGQEAMVMGAMSRASDFSEIIPAKYPFVTHWSQLLKERKPTQYRLWSDELGKMQLKALSQSRELYRTGELSSALYENRLLQQSEISATDAVRREVDLELALLFEKRHEDRRGTYLKARSERVDLGVNTGVVPGDTRPLSTPLVQWHAEQPVAVDNFYQSVGFFLPDGSRTDFLELVSSSEFGRLNPEEIEIYVSEDNISWKSIKAEKVEHIVLGRRAIVGFFIKPASFRYWKLHFPNASREATFHGRVSDLLHVYGSGES